MNIRVKYISLISALYIFIAFIVTATMGCQSSHETQLISPDLAAHNPSSQPIRLAAGDEIEIKFPYASSFNEIQTIRPDGKIMLPLVGTVQAAGKEPHQLRQELIQLHAEHLKHPQLAIIVRKFYERKVYVGGEVNQPGLIEMPGNLTALEAIMQAGSFNLVKAKVDEVTVIRQEEKKRKLYALNMRSAISGGEHIPFYLKPNDVVYVPPTTITNVAQWLNQHIYELLPSPSIGYSID